MRLNRRNVLIGLGTIVAGGGAALGTGAFSSVEATRTVDVTTTGDAGGLVGLNITGALEGEDGDTIEFDLDNLNVDAVTRFEDAFTVTNNRENAGDEIDLTIEDGDGVVTTDNAGGEGTGMYFETDTIPDDLNNIAEDGGSVTFDIVFNLEGETTTDDADGAIPDEITITADDSS
ncbi:hypothetical protein OB919_07840 [Halobacteria archaeon AArc-curdl1]|uniref:DUF1102 domain-containing protein n=1 Tax=Natronosalvus hydrolyticus TaxID=2979988 RepID=A0AAP2Z7V4_9EURY|nr:hypothetical protein [Halobacteria archaeon AArc-curdl1]